jgi:hypothetical protein
MSVLPIDVQKQLAQQNKYIRNPLIESNKPLSFHAKKNRKISEWFEQENE